MSAVMNNTGLYNILRQALCLIILAVIWIIPALADDNEPFILLLFSYSPDHPWVQEEKDAFMINFQQDNTDSPPPLVEHMDCGLWPDEIYEKRILDLYSHKYSRQRLNRSIDLVVAFDIPACTLALAHKDELFPDAYLILAGMTAPECSLSRANPRIERTTLIQLNADLSGTLEAMHKLQNADPYLGK